MQITHVRKYLLSTSSEQKESSITEITKIYIKESDEITKQIVIKGTYSIFAQLCKQNKATG